MASIGEAASAWAALYGTLEVPVNISVRAYTDEPINLSSLLDATISGLEGSVLADATQVQAINAIRVPRGTLYTEHLDAMIHPLERQRGTRRRKAA